MPYHKFSHVTLDTDPKAARPTATPFYRLLVSGILTTSIHYMPINGYGVYQVVREAMIGRRVGRMYLLETEAFGNVEGLDVKRRIGYGVAPPSAGA